MQSEAGSHLGLLGLANQSASKALFTCVVYTTDRHSISVPFLGPLLKTVSKL